MPKPLCISTDSKGQHENTMHSRSWHGLLIGLTTIIIGTGPSLGDDLDQSGLLGKWLKDNVSTPAYNTLLFEPDGHVISSFGTNNYVLLLGVSPVFFGGDGLEASAEYRLDGSSLTIDRGTDRSDGWVFHDDAARVTCTVTISEDRMELSNCQAFVGDADQHPIALADTVWRHAPDSAR